MDEYTLDEKIDYHNKHDWGSLMSSMEFKFHNNIFISNGFNLYWILDPVMSVVVRNNEFGFVVSIASQIHSHSKELDDYKF